MDIALITGSSGLIGSQAVEFFAGRGFKTVGIDNDMRRYFFGETASTVWNRDRLTDQVKGFESHETDIRNTPALEKIFAQYGKDVKLIIHTAAQPSHDWAAREPVTDFTINANGTLNLLELARRHCPKGVFIFTSTNKVYGDTPNRLPLVEEETRWELPEGHRYYRGIDETMSVDTSKHSLFGASKLAADVLVQEYGRYFGMNTACFRGGCLTGPSHSGAELHGFLSYLVRCCLSGKTYRILGYKGKQVRDNIHSYDLVNAFWHFYQAPRQGEVYNIGGGRSSNCSIREAIALCEKISGKTMNTTYVDENRSGDHIWWISDLTKFKEHYPQWELTFDVDAVMKEIVERQEGLKDIYEV